jgi:hypothetical protein
MKISVNTASLYYEILMHYLPDMSKGVYYTE